MLILNPGHFYRKYVSKINICKAKEQVNELETEIKKVFHNNLMDSKASPEEKEQFAIVYQNLLVVLSGKR